MPSDSTNPETPKQEGVLRALWRSLHNLFRKPLIGIGIFAAFLLVLGVSLHATEKVNVYLASTEFCVSCHSMEAYQYQEYQESRHYQTSSGVRPSCGDCHVSREFWPAVWEHMVGLEDAIAEASFDWHDPATMEDRRPAMAEKVRMSMLGNDSRACRTCHVMEAIQPQRARGQRAHENALESGQTCIACHYNLVHAPKDLSEPFSRAISGN